MRHLGFVFGIVFLVVSFSAVAADTNQRDYAVAFGVGLGSGLSVKKALSESTWIFANASMSVLNAASTLLAREPIHPEIARLQSMFVVLKVSTFQRSPSSTSTDVLVSQRVNTKVMESNSLRS